VANYSVTTFTTEDADYDAVMSALETKLETLDDSTDPIGYLDVEFKEDSGKFVGMVIYGFSSGGALPDGHNVTIDNASTDEVYVRGGGTAGSATDGEVVAVQGIASGTAMAVTESAPISGFATSAKQLADGHNVTVDNASIVVTATNLDCQSGGADMATAAGQLADGHNDTVDNASIVVTATNLDCQSGGADMATAAGQLADGHNVTEDSPALVGPAAITVDSYTQVAINLTTGADQVLVSSAANKQIWVYGYTIVCGDADGQTISFQDEDNAALSGVMEFAQYGGASVSPSGNFAMPLWKLGTDKDLEIDIGGGDADGHLTYAILSV